MWFNEVCCSGFNDDANIVVYLKNGEESCKNSGILITVDEWRHKQDDEHFDQLWDRVKDAKNELENSFDKSNQSLNE